MSDRKWDVVQEFIPAKKAKERPSSVKMRVIDAVLYITRAGCTWRLLPQGYFPPWGTVYDYFLRWSKTGVWQRMHDALRAKVRQEAGRHKHPTTGSIDAQSVKTSASAGIKGFDAVVVTAASMQDRDGAKLLLHSLSGSCKKNRRIWGDGGYRGKLLDWISLHFHFVLDVVLRSGDVKGFKLLPCRWVVERTFAWLYRYRRISKDYEVLIGCS